MAITASPSSDMQLARKVRERFVAELSLTMGEVGRAVTGRLTTLLEEVRTAREMQERQDAWSAFQRHGRAWELGVVGAWQKSLLPSAQPARAVRHVPMQFELMGDEVVENKILASRLSLVILDRLGEGYGELCSRIQLLEGTGELDSHDSLRPEVLILGLVEQWIAVGLARRFLPFVTDIWLRELGMHVLAAYASANAFLLANGVTPSTDLRSRLRRSDSAASNGPRSFSDSDVAHSGWSHTRAPLPGAGHAASGGADLSHRDHPAVSQFSASQETRLMTSPSPLARARRKAQGVMGHIKRLLTDHISDFDATLYQPVSPVLAQALAAPPMYTETELAPARMPTGSRYDYSPAEVSQVAVALRERSNELKHKATTSSEKATIEIVALMFQNILAEERIPPSVRVWFARLQLPVLRVALAEPEFFSTVDHPARQLIDRMGSCVMGFDASSIGGTTLDSEIRRVVQVIEQYPETGRRVFQLVFDEFVLFLSKYLTEKDSTKRLVTLAQQMEQKETLAIQYTIELRNMLKDMPVREAIREFLFKVWAEVLAMSAVRQGAQHEETLALKKAAPDLVWSASAKPNRADRARVIQSLPLLLQRLRQGMGLLGLDTAAQEVHIKQISDTLADAFMSKTEAIPQARIEAMVAHLANLEDFFSDEVAGDLPLDQENIELMLGMDASAIDVIADGGSTPTDAMRAWAQELQLGHWFMLDHNRQVSRVQFAWRSDRKQLHLFASTDGRSYLIQARRLAAYLQAGLLVPQEDEALTLRATRDALAKLDANPERLLA